MNDDVTINRIAVIERCLARVREGYGDGRQFAGSYRVQDAVVLNLQRACEAAIDLAMHVVSVRRLGIPQDTRSEFSMLHEHAVIDAELALKMHKMIGFRNIAVHDYQSLSLAIVAEIAQHHLDEFTAFCTAIARA